MICICKFADLRKQKETLQAEQAKTAKQLSSYQRKIQKCEEEIHRLEAATEDTSKELAECRGKQNDYKKKVVFLEEKRIKIGEKVNQYEAKIEEMEIESDPIFLGPVDGMNFIFKFSTIHNTDF